jgi:hypothetical protein
MNHDALRAILRTYLTRELICGHKDLAERCTGIGLASPPPPAERTKAERLKASLDATPDDQLPAAAERLLHGDTRISSSLR